MRAAGLLICQGVELFTRLRLGELPTSDSKGRMRAQYVKGWPGLTAQLGTTRLPFQQLCCVPQQRHVQLLAL